MSYRHNFLVVYRSSEAKAPGELILKPVDCLSSSSRMSSVNTF